MCEQQFFAEYVLGWRGPSGQKADKGTIVHKVLEILADIKKATQEGLKEITDNIVGKVLIDDYNIENLSTLIYNYYSIGNPHHKWVDKDRKDCYDWTQKAITYNEGMFDPRNKDIVASEMHFDFEIQKPWAEYSYQTSDGNISGNLALKGTIDLVTRVNDNSFEIIDWKTGKRRDWATGKEKTLESLQDDPQLRIYHYAVQHMYPEVENIMVTINYINDGGPFSIYFDKSDLSRTEDMLRAKFEVIRKAKKPKLSKTWMCNKLCHFGKSTFENTDISPIVEYRDGQICKANSVMTKCEQIKHDTLLYGIDTVVDLYKHKNYTIGKYKAPGCIE